MFIFVLYKEPPELSSYRRQSMEVDDSEEKTLLVHPNCYVRIMLEYIRKKCKLGIFSQFDLCDDTGALLGLFNLPTYEYVTNLFDHRRKYYIIVTKQENVKEILPSVYPQMIRDNPFYEELVSRVKYFLTHGEVSSLVATKKSNSIKSTPPISKIIKKKK